MKAICRLTLMTILALVPKAMNAGLSSDSLTYHDASTLPLLGTLAPDASNAYTRLPDSLKANMRPELWALGQNSAGLAVRFRSDASTIGAAWHSRNKFDMNHMTATGIRGLDLYVLDNNGHWTTMGSARPNFFRHNTRTIVMTDMEPKMREYMLYLSLYDGVDSLYIGTNEGALVLAPEAATPRRANPVIMYGTSILQGGCATRPGMCHTNIIERMIDYEVINLGFSGNAKLDLDIARLIASTPNPSVIVLDPLPNLKTPELVERMPEFYSIIRKAHPTTPILFVESPIFPLMRFNTETYATITEKNAALRQLVDGFIAAGDKSIEYFEGKNVLGDDPETTVDNYHLTDLGFVGFAQRLAPVIQRLIKQ